MSVCQAGQPLTSVCSRQMVCKGAPMSISWRAITGASRSMPVGVVMCVPSSAGVVGEDVDAGVAFGHVDHAAAVDQDVFGLVDELGRDGAAALCGVVGDVVAGDVRVAGVGDVVDLQAGVEVGEVDGPVVGCQAGQALLLVLVVRSGPAALGAKARRVVTGRGAGRGEEGHEDRVGFVGDVDGGDVAGGFVAVFPQRFAVDDDDVAAGQRDRGVHGDGGAERRVDAQGGNVRRVVFVGDVEDDQAAAHPRAVRPVAEGVGAAVQGQAVLRVGAAGGQPPLVGGGVGLAAGFVLPGVPPGAGGLGVGRVGDVDDGQDLAFEAGQVGGGVDPRAAVVEVAVGAGAADGPLAEQPGPVGLVHVPDEEAVLRGGVRVADGQAGRRVLQRGDH